jgi:dihydroflavonol-4-reductase
MKRILLTGATGHIGNNIARVLVGRGAEVVALVRKTADRRAIEGLALELRDGDLLDAASLDRAMEGCDGVIHAAANYADWAKDPAEITRPAVTGTENVLRAAARAGIGRVVATSSCVACGVSSRPDELRTEADWSAGSSMPYQQAKLDAERLALRLSRELGLELVTILPTLVLGPHDYRITPSTAALLGIANGTTPTFDGGANVVAVEDVALAHVAALAPEVEQGRYLVGGENLTIAQIGALVERSTGRQPKHLGLPRAVVMTAAALMEAVAGITGKKPGLTRGFAREVLGKYGWFDCSKARTALRIDPRPAAEVVEATLRWLAERGALEPAIGRAVLAASSSPATA